MVAVSASRFTGIALAVALGAFSLSAHAQVYKCKDSAGKTTYSGAPCEYGGKPLDISDNVIQGERPPPELYESAPSYVGGSGMSAECAQLQRQAMEQASKPPSRGIADSYRQRQNVNQALSAYEALCGGGRTTREEPKPSTKPKKNMDALAYPSSTMCPDGSFVPGKTGCKQLPDGNFVQGGSGVAQCPDGSLVGGKRCVQQPNGKFVGAN